jgi:hypothetical protein
VPYPHSIPFHYRRHIVAILLMGALTAALIEPGSGRTDILSDILVISAASLLGYATMRAFTWLAVRPLVNSWPRVARAWALCWFYGAVPLALLVLYFGSWKLHAPSPSPATIGLVLAAAVSMASGAFPVIHAQAGRLTTGSTATAAPATSVRSGEGR